MMKFEWILMVFLIVIALIFLGCMFIPLFIAMARDMWAFALA